MRSECVHHAAAYGASTKRSDQVVLEVLDELALPPFFDSVLWHAKQIQPSWVSSSCPPALKAWKSGSLLLSTLRP